MSVGITSRNPTFRHLSAVPEFLPLQRRREAVRRKFWQGQSLQFDAPLVASLVGAHSTVEGVSEYHAENSGRILSKKIPTNSDMCMGSRPKDPCSNQTLQP